MEIILHIKDSGAKACFQFVKTHFKIAHVNISLKVNLHSYHCLSEKRFKIVKINFDKKKNWDQVFKLFFSLRKVDERKNFQKKNI